ncbi:hypothetical protein [Kitasatospora sp. NPDC058478]|uniref:hypothetical protein n=1 Tax=unclassified Kitasatospora TaxID=2633591 RepID=UPI00364B89EB
MNSLAVYGRCGASLAACVLLLASGSGTAVAADRASAVAGAVAVAGVVTVPVGTLVSGMAVSPAGDKVYVTADGALKTVDTGTDTVTAQIPLANAESDYHQTVISPDGRRVYVVSGLVMNVVDTTTGTLLAAAPLPPQNKPAAWSTGRTHDIALSADGATVYVTQAGATGYNVPPIPPPGVPAETPGRVLTFSTAQNAFTGEVALPGSYAQSIALRPGGRDAYVAAGSGLVHLDTSGAPGAAPTVVGSVSNLRQAIRQAAFTPDGTHLFAVADSAANQVFPVDPATDAAQAPVTLAPVASAGLTGVSVSPDGTRLRTVRYDRDPRAVALVAFDTATYAPVPTETVPFTLDSVSDTAVSADSSTVYAFGWRNATRDTALQIVTR